MAIPEVEKQDIIHALKYIDEHGVPVSHQSTKYELLSEDGKRYPPKYVLAVAAHLAKGTDIRTDSFQAEEARSFLKGLGFPVVAKLLEKFQLSITADAIQSTDERFTMDNLSLGDGYKTLSVYLKRGDGKIVYRTYRKGERRNSNQTMARIAFQMFEKQIAALSVEEKEAFPICKYNPNSDVIRGIYPSVEEYRKHRKTIEYLTYYSYALGQTFVIYCWNVFSTILFVQECLKRFGQPGDQFVLTYREKDEKEDEASKVEEALQEELVQEVPSYENPYSSLLIQSKNLIFRGAPGTGKTYLAREIAADIVSDGYYHEYALLSQEQKQQVEFVQFHPSYDYSDFVEGLRPKLNEDGTMGFELKDGIFKKFVARARKNYEDSQKTQEDLDQEVSAQEAMSDFFETIHFCLAFSDYAFPMNLTPEELRGVLEQSGVDLALSCGAFAGDKLVGFIFHSISMYDGKLAAFDVGTAVLPEHRGKGIFHQMLEVIEQRLVQAKVEAYYLEVLQQNEGAIRLYQKHGFGVDREYVVLQSENETPQNTPFPGEEAEYSQFDFSRVTNCIRVRPSFEHSTGVL